MFKTTSIAQCSEVLQGPGMIVMFWIYKLCLQKIKAFDVLAMFYLNFITNLNFNENVIFLRIL